MIELMVGGALLLGAFVAGGAYTVSASRKRERAALERRILQLAREKQGRLAAADVALRSARTLDEAEAALRRLGRAGRADLIAGEQGSLIYEFAEFLPSAPTRRDPAPPEPSEEAYPS